VLFAKNHPDMVDRWLTLRESALAQARALKLAPDAPELERLDTLLSRAATYKAQDRMRYTYQPAAELVSSELSELRSRLAELRRSATEPGHILDALYVQAAGPHP
jgi:hypothetical protein